MRFVVVGLAVVLSACSSSGHLAYTPSVAIAAGPAAAVGGVTGIDKRDEKPNRLATIRGGYGNPLKVLDTEQPVADEVAGVVAKALQERGMLGAEGRAPYRVQVVLRTFYVNRWMESTAKLDMDLQVLDRSGRVAYTDSAKVEDSYFRPFSGGLFGDIKEQQAQGEALLTKTVDAMVDKPALRAVLVAR